MSDTRDALLELIAGKILTEKFSGIMKFPGDLGSLKWTGWKESWNHMVPHAQLLWVPPSPNEMCFYVDIPSMKHGPVKRGSSFDINDSDQSHYLNRDTSPEEIKAWFKEAMMLLIEDVLASGPLSVNNPLEK